MNLPYFNEIVLTIIFCENCDYKYSDVIITEQKEPLEYKIVISEVDDLKIRIIRSSSATVELPELGIKIELGAASEAYISNVEGLLNRVVSVIEQAIRFADDEDKKVSGNELLETIEQLRNGEGQVTILIKDPFGNSGIISDKAEKRELSPDELKFLETGINIIDVTDKEMVD
jgi:zinc finger protein